MSKGARYALIGGGMMGREHIENITQIGGTVTAIADPDSQSQKACREAAPDALITSDYRRLLEQPDFDMLVLASPNHTHFPIIKDLLSTLSIPLLIEKPVCIKEDEIRYLRAHAASYKAPLWIAMEYRYSPPVSAYIEKLESGICGPLRMLSIREHRFPFLEKVGSWNRFENKTGGTFVEKCCHFFDLMRFIIGQEPELIFASGSQAENHLDATAEVAPADVIDHGFVTLEFSGHQRALLDLCMFAEGAAYQESFCAVGNQGRLDCFVPGPPRFWPGALEDPNMAPKPFIEWSPRHQKAPERSVIEIDEAIRLAGDHQGATHYQHLKFAKTLHGGAVEVTMEDGLRAVEIGLAAERSAKNRQPVLFAQEI